MKTALSDVWGKDPLWDKMACGMNRTVVEIETEMMDRGVSGWSLGWYAEHYLPFIQGPLKSALTQNGYTEAAAKADEVIATLGAYKGHRHDVKAPNADADSLKVSLAFSTIYRECPPLAERQLTATEYCSTRHARGHKFPEMDYDLRAVA